MFVDVFVMSCRVLLPMFAYLIMCRAVLFNRVRLCRVVDFTGLPVYWFTGFINLSVLLYKLSLFLLRSCRSILLCFNRALLVELFRY